MVPGRDVDPAQFYARERVTFVAFLRALPTNRLAGAVPATPAWSVLDVVAHVVGITADLNAQRFDVVDADAWTATQVESRRRRSIDELAAEWEAEAPTFEDGLRLFGYEFGAHYLGDLVQHVVDVHAAIGERWHPPDDHLAVALDAYLGSFEETLHAAARGAVDVRVADERWRLGPGEVVASLETSRLELFRSLGGRRTLAEIRSLAWDGAVDRVAGLVSCYPVPTGSLRESALPVGGWSGAIGAS